VFALPIFPGSRPSSIVGVHELNFCVRDGRVAPRCLWQMKRGISECRGRQETSLRRQAKFLPGTANGNRWTGPPVPTVLHKKKGDPFESSLCLRYLSSRGSRACPLPVAESRASVASAAIGERGRRNDADENTEYRKRMRSLSSVDEGRCRAPQQAARQVLLCEA